MSRRGRKRDEEGDVLGSGEKRPGENEQHKKDTWKAFGHYLPFLLPPRVPPISVGAGHQQAGASPHTPVGTQPSPRHHAHPPCLSPRISTPHAHVQGRLMGPPWMQ